jgi:16S rRNA U516 pseudouridylate synthase RsuA-like enzyme
LNDGILIDGIQYGKIIVNSNNNKSNNNSNNSNSTNNWLTMTLTEGKNREIRRVMECFGNRVNRLIRLSYGPFHIGIYVYLYLSISIYLYLSIYLSIYLTIGDLKPGEIVEVDEQVVDMYRDIR